MDKVTLRTGGNVYEGWQKVRISRSLTAMSGTFELELTWQHQGSTGAYDAFIEGLLNDEECLIEIGGERLITGYLDDLIPSYDDSTITINVTGRDKTSDLIDCCVVQQSGQFKSQTLGQIAKTVCAPFGISVEIDTGIGAVFERVQVEQGETAYEFLSRLAKPRGVLLTTNGYGALVITRTSAERGEVALKLGVNVKAARGRFSRKQRFSEYIVKANGISWKNTSEQPIEGVGGISATVSDDDIKRYRPMIFVNDEIETAEGASLRGKWERQRAISRSNSAEYTLTGWRNPNTNNLLSMNKIVPVTDAIMKIDGDMLISGLMFSEDDESGRIAVISVVHPDALTIPTQANISTTLKAGWKE